MTIAEYQSLTGNTVSETDAPRMKAMIRRAESKLSNLLGYSLSKQKRWTELGKIAYSDYTPYFSSLPVSDEAIAAMSPPDEEFGTYQLFTLDELDTHIRINPAKQFYRAKLVRPVSDDEFVTVYDLEYAIPYLNNAGLVTAITRDRAWYTWSWWLGLPRVDRGNLMLAVDADFVNVCDANRYPDLAYLLADMVDYYAHPSYSVMGNLRSESIDSHSYSRASTGKDPDSMAPEGQPSAKRIIERYAGPSAFRKLVR